MPCALMSTGDSLIQRLTLNSSNVRDTTTLTFEVFAHRQLHHDQYIGTVQGTVKQFLRYPDGK